MGRVLALAIAAIALAVAPTAAQPDPAPPDAPPDGGDGATANPADAKRWMAAGDTLIKKGDALAKRGKTADAQSQYERALLAYQKAFEASSNPQLYYAIAAAEEKLGKTKDALLHYRKVTLEVSDNPKLIELATNRLGELSMAYGLFTATVEPAGAEITVDGTAVGAAPMAEPVVLDPGTYTVVITADGYQPLEVKITMEGGSESERTFKLDPVPVVFEQPKDAPRKVVPVPPPSRPSSVLVWIGGGATLTLSAIAGTTGLLALSKHKTFDDMTKTPETRESARKSGKRLALATDLCTIGAVVAATFTAVYYFAVYKPRAGKFRKASERRQVTVAPWIEPTIGGVAFGVTY